MTGKHLMQGRGVEWFADDVSHAAYIKILEDVGVDIPLARRADTVSASITYEGYADVGTLDSEALWKIKRVTTTGNDTSIEHAVSGAFSQVWDDRASLTYT